MLDKIFAAFLVCILGLALTVAFMMLMIGFSKKVTDYEQACAQECHPRPFIYVLNQCTCRTSKVDK